MKTNVLKSLLVMLVLIAAIGIISANADAQIIDPIDYTTGFYYPVWSLAGIGAP